jgi:hypothetical protein
MENLPLDTIAQRYKALGDSVDLINAILSGTLMEPEARQRAAIDRNVRHLELMRVKNFWTDEDMTAVDAAITAGNAYLVNVPPVVIK